MKRQKKTKTKQTVGWAGICVLGSNSSWSRSGMAATMVTAVGAAVVFFSSSSSCSCCCSSCLTMADEGRSSRTSVSIGSSPSRSLAATPPPIILPSSNWPSFLVPPPFSEDFFKGDFAPPFFVFLMYNCFFKEKNIKNQSNLIKIYYKNHIN